MDRSTALAEAMQENGFTDEDVAVRIRVKATTVRRWRTRERNMRPMSVQALRDKVPGFAERLDAQKTNGARHVS